MNTTTTPMNGKPQLRLLPPLAAPAISPQNARGALPRPHLARAVLHARTALESLQNGEKYDDNLGEYAARLESIAAQIRAARVPALQIASGDSDDDVPDDDTAPEAPDDDRLREILEAAKAGEAEAIAKLKREQNEKLK